MPKAKDIFLKCDDVYFGESKASASAFSRAKAFDEDGKIVNKVGETAVHWGYGRLPSDAINDFIRRNDVKVIEAVVNNGSD